MQNGLIAAAAICFLSSAVGVNYSQNLLACGLFIYMIALFFR